MAKITLGGNPAETSGDLPKIGSQLSNFKLVAVDLSNKTLDDFKDSNLILNIFPSVNTGVCAASVRTFNKTGASLNNTKVLCISRDLPFAQDQFCGAEGLENVVMLSDFRNGDFGKTNGLIFTNSAFEGLLSRSIIAVNDEGKIIYTEQVSETGDEPDYEAALNAFK